MKTTGGGARRWWTRIGKGGRAEAEERCCVVIGVWEGFDGLYPFNLRVRDVITGDDLK